MRVYKTGPVANDANLTGAVDQKNVVEVWCLSTDSKPTAGIAEGSVAIEIDTGKAFFFNETTSAWVEVQ